MYWNPPCWPHGRVVHTDVPAALTYLLFFFALHSYAESPSLKRALLLALACGIALATKFSMIVIVPVLALAGVALFWKASLGARWQAGCESGARWYAERDTALDEWT